MENKNAFFFKNIDEFKKEFPNDTNITIRCGNRFIIVTDQRSKEY